MLGSNPSADSVASTDSRGDATASPFRYLLEETPYRERQQSAKSWGYGGKAPIGFDTHRFMPNYGRPLIMHNPILGLLLAWSAA